MGINQDSDVHRNGETNTDAHANMKYPILKAIRKRSSQISSYYSNEKPLKLHFKRNISRLLRIMVSRRASDMLFSCDLVILVNAKTTQ